MPTEYSPAARHQRAEFPEIADQIGYDPARFLDRELSSPQYQRSQIERDSSGSVVSARLVPDRDTSTGAPLVEAVINGIDRLEVIDAWIDVEVQLDRGPRKSVIAMLNQRRAILEAIGERPDRLHAGPRLPPDWYDDEQSEDVQDDERLTAMEQLHRKQAATGGGES